MYDPQEDLEEDLEEDNLATVSLTTQQLNAAEEKNKMIRRLLVFGLFVFAIVFYFVWQNVINFGYIKIYGKVPYDVMVFEEKSQDCNENPCVIKLKRGEKTLLFHKIGYDSPSANAEVPLWGTATIRVDFELVPYMKQVDSIPALPAELTYPEYELKYDEIHHNWMLVKKGDEKVRPLAYFPEKLSSPQIFGTDNSVLIVEKHVRFIDLSAKQTHDIGTIGNKIIDVKPSINGQYYLLSLENEEGEKSIAIADKYRILESTVPSDFADMHWTLHTQIASTYKENNDWVFNIYKPESMVEKILVKTGNFSEDSVVENFFPSTKKSSLFFTVKAAADAADAETDADAVANTAYEIVY